jgi:integrase/recombinase XerD
MINGENPLRLQPSSNDPSGGLKVTDKDSRMLMDAILDYMGWVKSMENAGGSPGAIRYTRILTDFLIYVIHKRIAWEKMFTLRTVEAFRRYSGYKGAFSALRALSDYLFSQGRIDHPLNLSKPTPPLPDVYEGYLLYHSQALNSSPPHLRRIRRVLRPFHEYLGKNGIPLSKLTIEHCDAFMATFKVSDYSRRLYRYCLRGFLKYLYHEKKIIKRDLAPLLVGPPQFAQKRLPRFLRPHQVKKLFASLKLSTPTEIRTYALMHLAYSLGLRPAEISRITLDDISFQQRELTLRERKGGEVITLPVAENTIKAIALYVSKGRPQGPSRYLFLNHQFPYHPMRSNNVVGYIAEAMKQAGLPSSAYWLRHTYAQNLLHMGRSIYEVKEMMGHQNIQSTHRYLHIHTELMRKVLFDEEL